MLRFNPMKDGPINVDWQLTPVNGLVQVGSVQPFPITEFHQANFGINFTVAALKQREFQSIRDNIGVIANTLGAEWCDEWSWANEHCAPMWHTDNFTQFHHSSKWNATFIMSLTPDPSRTTTLFQIDDKNIFHCKSWHMYLARHDLSHYGPSGFWKVFLRFYANLPFEV